MIQANSFIFLFLFKDEDSSNNNGTRQFVEQVIPKVVLVPFHF